MFMILILHILGNGGILDNVRIGSLNYYFFWGLEVLCFVAVNCFSLITGYFMSKGKWRIGKFLQLWVEVVFYSITLSFVAYFILGEIVPISMYADSLFPLFKKSYWFFSAYAGLFLFMPLLNKAINGLTKKEMTYGVFVILILGSGSILFRSDPFNLAEGYSMVWLIFMYFIGAFIRLHVNVDSINKKSIVGYYLGINVVSLGFIALRSMIGDFEGSRDTIWFIHYVSPLILASSILLFIIFLKTPINGKETSFLIEKIVPHSFAVYLIHTHPIIFYFMLKDRFIFLANESIIMATIQVLLFAILIYLSCLLIDCIRSLLFQFLQVPNVTDKIGKKLHQLIGI
ncbi:hypothetical protein RU98_GL000081 [Enterococcus caccae]|nr:hypothetical protein RU98_GL000081 [Enterococcus caccae]